MNSKIVLVDGYSLMYRAFHALPLMDNGEGEYTNAIYGFLNMLLKVIEEEKPQYCLVAFDEHGKTFRHERFSEYKAGRAPTPEEMKTQIVRIREILTLAGIAQLGLAGYEADDILGTISRICEETGVDALIVTGDRDSYQLAGERTTILYTKRGITDTERVTPEWIQEKYGVEPIKMRDIKGLMGDASDNIPGVPGIGEKTAMKLIHQFGSLENALDRAQDELKGSVQNKLLTYRDQAIESKFLGTIDRHAPIEFDFENAKLGQFSNAFTLMQKLKLRSLVARIREMEASNGGKKAEESVKEETADKPPVVRVQGAQALKAQIEKWFDNEIGLMAVYIGEGFSACLDTGETLTAEIGGDLLSPGLTNEDIVSALMPLYKSERTGIAVHNIKSFPGDIQPFKNRAEDTMLAGYVLNPQRSAGTLEDACALENVEFNISCPAESLMALIRIQKAQMEKNGLTDLYKNVEMPLAFVLKDMEKAGFRADGAYLQKLGEKYAERIEAITHEIRSLAGDYGNGINLNSPKQLSKLLFEDLNLPVPGGKKSKMSTAAEVLEELSGEYPICEKILEYRKYQKLSSTYVDGMLPKISKDGRIHTSFEQAVTGTGRISSRDPNLQNIPVRTELGREIRTAFIAEEGCVLVDADYSQIELRVLAHMSGDPAMQDAFNKDQDIHTRTAAEVYGVSIDQVTREMRSNAKAVNFGIVYGISDFGLARNIGVSRREAAEFIEKYNARYPYVKKYMDEQVALGKAQGYVSTLFSRRRYLPELQSASYNMRSFGERAAMNSPIQGTAADIIKIAMVKVDEMLKKEGLKARLILQVHDELIVEAPLDERETVERLLIDGMESVLQMDVPLRAELSTGGNWNECKS
ncbi:MAG: DNA polymerase I [Clostridia bacterium]|nr:DNA polymerase I [Clostridia bacterium]